MPELSKEGKIALITIASTIGGAITGGIAGVVAGIAYVKEADSKIYAFNIARYAILPACIITGAALSGTIGYFASQSSEKNEP